MKSKSGNDGRLRQSTRKTSQQTSIQEKHREILNSMMHSNIMKPTNVEAQRILKVCEEWCQNVEILQYIHKDFVGTFYVGEGGHWAPDNDSLASLSEGTLKLFQNQADIEQQYNSLQVEEEVSEKEAKLNKSRNEEDEFYEEDQQDEEDRLRLEQEQLARRAKRTKQFERCKKLLDENTMNLIRSVRKNSQDYMIIKTSASPNQDELSDILVCVRSIQVIIQKKLSTAAEEEEQKVNQLAELSDKIASLQQSRQNIQNELDKYRHDRQKHNQMKREEINSLRQQLDNVKSNKVARIAELERSKKAQVDQMHRDLQKNEEQLNSQNATQLQSFNQQKKGNKDLESALKKKKQNMEQQCVDSYNNYDQLMESWKEEKGQIQREYNLIRSELKQLQDHFKDVDHEKLREKEVDAEIQAIKDAHYLHKRKQFEAARSIQIAFRTYKSKSTKKKKGKGKKKKT